MKLHLPLSLLVYVGAVWHAAAAVGDTGSAWDARWGADGLTGAPDAAAPQYQAAITASGVTALVQPAGQPAPYDFGTYTAITLVGAGNGGAQIFGGASATDSVATGAVERNTWIAAEAGQYQMLVGGNYADNWNSGTAFHFTGNSHILVNGASTDMIVGGNFKDGQSASFTGNSYISVMGGNVRGAIMGAGVVAHNRDVQFTGDTNVFVYIPLADNSGTAFYLLPSNMVMGGYGWATNTRKTQTITGNTHVTVDLAAYTGAEAPFAKHVVGGGFSGASGNAQVIDGNTFVTVDLGTQAMAAGVRVVGGHWVNAGGGTVTGVAHLSINGGTFNGWVVGASWTDVAGTSTSYGGVQMQLNGGTLNGNAVGASYLAAGLGNAQVGSVQAAVDGATLAGTLYGGYYINGTGTDSVNAQVGDIAITLNSGAVNHIIGGSYVPRNNADAVVRQGHVTISLQGGTVNGNIHAAGQQAGATAMQTDSTTVSIGSAVAFADSSVVSGGYAGGNVTSAVNGERVLVFADAQTYTNVAAVGFESFDSVSVAEGAAVTLESLTMVQSLQKSGGGALVLSAHDTLAGITVSGGMLDLAAGQDAAALQRLTMAGGTQLRGLSGTLSTADTVLALELSAQNIGENAAATPMLLGSALVVDIASAANVTLDLSADAVVELLETHREAGVVSWLTLTDGTLQFADTAATAIVPELFAYGIRVAGVSGGSLLLSGQAQGLYYVLQDPAATDPHLVTTYPTLGMYEGVVIEGGQTLSLSLAGDANPATQAVVRNLAGGSASSLVVQNSSGSGTSQVELEQLVATTMAGSIAAGDGTELIKTGPEVLTVQGAFTAPALQVQNGTLLLGGTGNALQQVGGNGTLLLGAGSATTFSFNTDAAERIVDLARLVLQDGASLTLHSVGAAYLGAGEYVLGTLDELQAGDYTLTLSGTPFMRVDATRSFLAQESGQLLLVLVGAGNNPLAEAATSHNARAGAELLWNAPATPGGAIQAAYNEAMQLLRGGNTAAANELMAAVAGSSYTALGAAFRHELQQRLYAIRNRTTHMGLSECFVYDDIPLWNAWLNADGAYSELRADGTAAGYKLSSWGGTVGMDIAFDDAWCGGLAFTALYGDMDASAPDALDGDFDTYTLALFAQYEKRRWSHTFIAAGSWLEADMHRSVSVGAHRYTTAADTHGFGLGLMYELGYKIPFNEQRTAYVQPIAHVVYTHSSVRGFTESGSDAALTMGNQSQNALVFGLGLRAQTTLAESDYDRFATLQGRALLKIHTLDRRCDASAAFADGAAAATVISAQDGVLGAEIGAGLTIPIGAGSGVLFLDAAAEFRADAVDVFGSVGYRFRF
ncbi:MAG: autotransporter domain-containing protein [Akkermansiaceae bacterium]|nr:autotransporter domain-containing protein [Akkermansiaceae bacterium]